MLATCFHHTDLGVFPAINAHPVSPHAEGGQLATVSLQPGLVIALHHAALCVTLVVHGSLADLYVGYE